MKKYIYLLLLVPLMAFGLHKFYLSTIRIEYKPNSKSVQITMRIFIDDLQEVLNKKYHKDFELALPNEKDTIDALIKDYISKTFFIRINDQIASYNYLGKEYDADLAIIYMEVNDISSINSIEIKDEMLFEMFPDQKNIIKLFINDIKKTFFLTVDKQSDLLKI